MFLKEENFTEGVSGMHKMRFILYGVILSLLIPSVALSETEEIKEYKIMKGDTLWDISGKELHDSFLWPKVWQENPQIGNPDRIYPGQTIRIPLRLLKGEAREAPEAAPVAKEEQAPVKKEAVAAEKEKKPTPVPLTPLVDKALLMSSGYIADSVHSVGGITGSPFEKNLFGNDDIVYVSLDAPAKIGDEFYVIRPGEVVRHPVTGKKLGYLIEVLGVATVDRFEFGQTMAKITQVFDAIKPGDLLDTYHDMTPPLTTGACRTPSIDGYVVALRSGMAAGNLEIVYIDKGSTDGVEVGDMLRTVFVGTHKVPSGKIQVISSREKTSTAIVRENYNMPIASGNLVTGIE
jgi:hypothetical protein